MPMPSVAAQLWSVAGQRVLVSMFADLTRMTLAPRASGRSSRPRSARARRDFLIIKSRLQTMSSSDMQVVRRPRFDRHFRAGGARWPVDVFNFPTQEAAGLLYICVAEEHRARVPYIRYP